MLVLLEFLLDGILLALCSIGLFDQSKRKPSLFFLSCSTLCVIFRTWVGGNENPLYYLLLPVDSIWVLPFLFIGALWLNSLWFQASEGHIFWGTTAQFALYLLVKFVCALGLGLIGLESGFWAVYGSRLLAILLWWLLWETETLHWLRDRLSDGDTLIRIIACNSLLVLVLLWTAYLQYTFSRGIWLLVAISILAILILADGLAFIWDQHHIQNRQRSRLLEQYLPMVEELVESVRARQHEFNNRMLAVSAAVDMAATLDEAKTAVAGLVGQVGLDATDRELLRCDSKVISGMLFGKTKQAELRHIRLEIAITAALLHRSLSETGWIELIGILVDNALEASSSGDTIFLRADNENGMVRLTVSNPCPPVSNIKLTEMFKRGWSTKADTGRGYGLFNARRLVEQHGGKIIIRNERMCGQNYLTIGALVP
nr:ATP-binding protein [uncultured Oscillibacter sp.]